MKPFSVLMLLSAGCLCASLGCANLDEQRTIAAFTKSLESADLEGLRENSSEDFRVKGLRREDALEVIKQLKLPEADGKLTVVEVEDKAGEKRVTVELGEKKRKLLFTLVRDPQRNDWVVDDIDVKRKPKPGQVNKSVAEQMDLLLSIRECLGVWQDGNREQVLSASTASLGEALGELPPACLEKLTRQVTQGIGKKGGVRPQVEGHKDAAVVRISRKTGEILMTLRLIDGHWKIDDMQVASKREADNIPSVRKLASVMNATVAFYEAYQQQDKPALGRICTNNFFETSLSVADLTTVQLPVANVRGGDFEVKLQNTRAIGILKSETGMVQISLIRYSAKQNSSGSGARKSALDGPRAASSESIVLARDSGEDPAEDSDNDEDDQTPIHYRVEEVTLHELDGKQEKRLSAVFTSHAIMHVFSEALASRNMKMLLLSASPDFCSRVWRHLEQTGFDGLPLENIEPVPPQVIDMVFKGPVTEILVNQGTTPLTYILRDHGGKLLVDDIQFPSLDRPNSLKLTLELMIPVRDAATAFQTGRVDALRRTCSREFNKVIWNQLETLPPLGDNPAKYLQTRLSKVQLAPDRAVVVLGDENWGAKVFLVKESERYSVDDIILVGGVEQQQRIGLKQHIRGKLSQGASTIAAPRNRANDPMLDMPR